VGARGAADEVLEAADHWQHPWRWGKVKLWFGDEQRLEPGEHDDEKHGQGQDEEQLAAFHVAILIFFPHAFGC